MKKHDKVGKFGFNVEPELLAHDLAMLKLSKQKDIGTLDNNLLYDEYTRILDEMENEIVARIRYDSGLSK